MAKNKFYVVWEGKETGIFQSWDLCKSLIEGYKGAKYKSFPTMEEAKEAFFHPPKKEKNAKKETSLSNKSNEKFIKDLLNKGNIVVFTDGGALGNPGVGGYGAVLKFLKNGKMMRKELSGGFKMTTNNRMELLGVIKALESIKNPNIPIDVFSDSKYVVDANSLGWVEKWRKNGWIKSNKEEAKNIDLWERLLNLTGSLNVNFHWVKGHAGIVENERCDELANIAMNSNDLEVDKNYESIL